MEVVRRRGMAQAEATEAVEWVLRHFFLPNQSPNEYEGGRGPTFTPPPTTKPHTGNQGAAGSFDHDAAAVGSHAVAAGGLGDPTGGGWLRSRRPRRGGGRVSRGVRRQRASSEI
jgi:hypothetical protein